MSGKHEGLPPFIPPDIPYVKRPHCCIHGESMAARNRPDILKATLQKAEKLMNPTKGHPLNSCIFNAFST
jgi:hypothetical protein